MSLPRTSGILLHPTSLPGPSGIGDLGPEAYRFADFLAATGQGLWQVLPLGPTGYGNSPYMAFSSFAGNPLLISLEQLAAEGLLDPAEIAVPPALRTDRVDYPSVIRYKMPRLRAAFERFLKHPPPGGAAAFEEFRGRNASWLRDYSLFMALKEAYGGRPWPEWDEGLVRQDRAELARAREHLAGATRFHEYLQFVFFRQWESLKAYCHGKGIRIIGDLPIYVAHDSAEVWADQDEFQLDPWGYPLMVGGVPRDYYSPVGQRWGHPVYRWDCMAETGYRWWIDRVRAGLTLADMLRLDHFRGFEAYWEIPACEPLATRGRWVKGPGAALFEAIRSALGDVPLIAEDLGVITPEVDALRDRFGFPGMRILQRAFATSPKAPEYRPHNHIYHCVVYTATHDHNTTVGWFTSDPDAHPSMTREQVLQERALALKYIGTDGRQIHWDFIRMALASVARMAVFPLQDVMGLGAEARMNLPGTLEGNWEWRFTWGMLTPEMTARLADLTALYERGPIPLKPL